ncbi:MAG TPA: flagellar export protein FliJ [Steroidobacteraceae bacterium]|nr:flagellar export protein FliJ [Steroidobacteraceae bacterium]
MSRAKRLQPVQNLVDDKERRLAQSLAGFEKKLVDAERKLQELERYRAEYERQFKETAARGIGVTGLRDYQAFLARLNEAIRQQQSVVQRAHSERDAERLRWQEMARKAKALDHVVETWNVQEQRARDRREQIETDERAQRRVKST